MLRCIILLALLQVTFSGKLPESYAVCKQNDPKLNDCLNAAMSGVIPDLGKNGIASLDMKPLEPMAVMEIKVDQGRRGPVSLKLVFNNLQIYGIPESTISNFNAALSTYNLKFETSTPRFRYDADYVMDGQILVLPVKGRGRCNITLVDLITTHELIGSEVQKDGQKYMLLEKYEIKLHPKRVYSHFENLFNGDKKLGQTMNAFMNEHWEVIFNELKPALEKAFGSVFHDYAKILFDKVPFDSIFVP